MIVAYSLNTDYLCLNLQEWETLEQCLFDPLLGQVLPECGELQQKAKRVAELS